MMDLIELILGHVQSAIAIQNTTAYNNNDKKGKGRTTALLF
jgi:hypothetical protein